MKSLIKIRKKVAAQFGLELWWDRHQKLWTLMDVATSQVCDHYYSTGYLKEMTAETFRDECIDLVIRVGRDDPRHLEVTQSLPKISLMRRQAE